MVCFDADVPAGLVWCCCSTGPELICYPAPKVARAQGFLLQVVVAMHPLPRGGEEDDEGEAGQGQCGPDLQVLRFRSNLSVCELFSLDSELPSVETWKGPVGRLIAISPSSLMVVYLSLFRIY